MDDTVLKPECFGDTEAFDAKSTQCIGCTSKTLCRAKIKRKAAGSTRRSRAQIINREERNEDINSLLYNLVVLNAASPPFQVHEEVGYVIPARFDEEESSHHYLVLREIVFQHMTKPNNMEILDSLFSALEAYFHQLVLDKGLEDVYELLQAAAKPLPEVEAVVHFIADGAAHCGAKNPRLLTLNAEWVTCGNCARRRGE